LVVAQPAGGTLNVSLPVGYQTLTVPSAILPNSALYISDAQVALSPSITVNAPLICNNSVVCSANPSSGITVTGLPAGVLSFAPTYTGSIGSAVFTDCDTTTPGGSVTCTFSPGTTDQYTINFNTIGLTAGTVYTGTIAVTGKNTNNTSYSASPITVNLTVTGTPAVVALSNPVNGSSTPLTSITLSAVVGQSSVCTGSTIATGAPSFLTNGGTLGSASFASSVASGVNFITAPSGALGSSLTSTATAVQFCVNPQLLGNSPGRYTGTVTLTVPGAANSPLTIPVTLLLGNTPGHIELSNAGVYRAAGTLGAFVLNLDQLTYNYAAANTLTRFFGLPGDQPVAGDWTGSGTVSIGIFRGGAWYFDLNNDGAFESNEGPFYFGLPGDKAIVGDWTGSGSTKVGVFRCPASGVCTWYLSTASQTAATLVPGANLYTPSSTLTYNYGLPGDQPVSSNWLQTGKVDQIGVFRCPTTGVCSWIVDSAGTGASFTTYSFGLPGDIAVVGDWNDNNQAKRIGVFRPSLGEWILDVNGSNTYAPNDIQGYFGLPGDIPVVGKWTMQ